MWAWIWSSSISSLGVCLDLIPLNFPLGCGPGSDPPLFLPWVWAWKGSPWQGGLLGRGSPWRGVSLAGGSPWQGVSLVGGSPWQGVSLAGEGGSPCQGASFLGDPPPWTEFLTHASENITLPQTSFAGGNNRFLFQTQGLVPPPSGNSWIRHWEQQLQTAWHFSTMRYLFVRCVLPWNYTGLH